EIGGLLGRIRAKNAAARSDGSDEAAETGEAFVTSAAADDEAFADDVGEEGAVWGAARASWKKRKKAGGKSPARRASDDDAEEPGRLGDDGTLASPVAYEEYDLPDLHAIFPPPPEQPLEFTEEELLEQKLLLEAQLNNFKVRGKVTGIHPGPVITRYEVELAPGEKVNRISGLADDLALALRAKRIRILAPIPGKSLVGVEVPNRKPQIVYIKEILESERFKVESDGLKVALGK